jgi:hypothetical protein
MSLGDISDLNCSRDNAWFHIYITSTPCLSPTYICHDVLWQVYKEKLLCNHFSEVWIKYLFSCFAICVMLLSPFTYRHSYVPIPFVHGADSLNPSPSRYRNLNPSQYELILILILWESFGVIPSYHSLWVFNSTIFACLEQKVEPEKSGSRLGQGLFPHLLSPFLYLIFELCTNFFMHLYSTFPQTPIKLSMAEILRVS